MVIYLGNIQKYEREQIETKRWEGGSRPEMGRTYKEKQHK